MSVRFTRRVLPNERLSRLFATLGTRAAVPDLTARSWGLKYTPDDGDLVEQFYVPALECAVRYDRATGYFGAAALALAMRGIEGLVRNDGRMRLIVGCTLDESEVAAIEKGEALRDTVQRHLAARPLEPPDDAVRDALELLAWMIAHGYLDVKVAVPCDDHRRPMSADGIFHEKSGIIEDSSGNRLAFNGSINETYAGWKKNWESFNVFTSWTGTAGHAALEAENFARLWANKAKHALTLDVPEAVRSDLLRFMPESDLPARLAVGAELVTSPEAAAPPKPNAAAREESSEVPTADLPPASDLRRQVWSYITRAPTLPNGGERVGEATCAVDPWPHQIRAFERLYAGTAPRLLIADEVGLGKTIQAGMLLRQMWLAGRARRILILTPAAVMRQWQLELREKFNLNWPIYDDGRLTWCLSPAMREGKSRGPQSREVSRAEWHKEPVVIASSHLMRRRDRDRELCEDAEPWDLVILDEAHHARRKGAGSAAEEGPNALLRLMRRLRERSPGLVLLTATPMQVHPIELWDLLDLLGLPAAWGAGAFLRFFELLGKPAPSHAELDELAAMFRAAERAYGETTAESLARLGVTSNLRARRILGALRDQSSIPRRALGAEDRATAVRLMRVTTPVSRLVSRHTRDLLRKYYKAGKISTPIADRAVRDDFIAMTPAERAVYDAVEDYISTTYNQAASSERNAVGFVMTVYRRRLASSFRALRNTLEARLAPLANAAHAGQLAAADDASDDESRDDVMDADEAAGLEKQALRLEERHDIEALLRRVAELPVDTKARRLKEVLDELRHGGYTQAMVFTQFTDTMDFLRGYLAAVGRDSLLCFSGRGGEVLGTDGRWTTVSRDEVKRRFRESRAEILLCTDAAAEGLNFQFCGALVNYDMPWNPMRVEQRIGRIDRVGQEHPTVRIVNLHYSDTVEADVYAALRNRIGLFESVVGRLQPILAQLPRTITDTVLRGRATDEARARVAAEVTIRVDELSKAQTGLDLDLLADDVLEIPERHLPALDLEGLDVVIRCDDVMPPAVVVRKLGKREYGYFAPGMPEELRVTTDSEYFEQHPDSVELWSPGSPVFPEPLELAEGECENSLPPGRLAEVLAGRLDS
ncbi:MAG TPA: helicase-related protein [Gemmatimonadaceae bacterium]|jgi:SNF2 family DNA or RNA helicase|nr:helicase-related protein [Gemmatimonadaceae bacterium]